MEELQALKEEVEEARAPRLVPDGQDSTLWEEFAEEAATLRRELQTAEAEAEAGRAARTGGRGAGNAGSDQAARLRGDHRRPDAVRPGRGMRR